MLILSNIFVLWLKQTLEKSTSSNLSNLNEKQEWCHIFSSGEAEQKDDTLIPFFQSCGWENTLNLPTDEDINLLTFKNW